MSPAAGGGRHRSRGRRLRCDTRGGIGPAAAVRPGLPGRGGRRWNRAIDGIWLRRPPAANGCAREYPGNRHGPRFARPAVERRELKLRGRPSPQRVGQPAPQHLVHQRLFEEPHLRLRRVHVHVHAIGRDLDEQVDLGTAFLDRRDAVGLGNGVRDGAVLDDATVDEYVLGPANRTVIAERRNVTMDRDPRRVLLNLDQIRTIAEQLKEPLRQPRSWRTLEHRPHARRQRPADLRVAERQLRDQPRDLGRLGNVGLEELASRRQVEEQIRDLDAGSLARADVARGRRPSAIDPDLGAALCASRPRAKNEVRDRRDAGKRFPAKPERPDRAEVVWRPDLAGGMPLDRELRVLGVHALAVVFDADQLLAPQLDRDRDAGRGRVERVLDQLLHDRGRALDDLAGGNLVREVQRQTMDAGHGFRVPGAGFRGSVQGSRFGSGFTVQGSRSVLNQRKWKVRSPLSLQAG